MPLRPTSMIAVAMLLAIGLTLVCMAESQQGATAKPAGQMLLHEKGCTYCHGDALEGTERGPRLTDVGRRLSLEQIEKQIQVGGDAMPAFGDSLEASELQSLAEYLARQKAKTPRAKPLTQTVVH